MECWRARSRARGAVFEGSRQFAAPHGKVVSSKARHRRQHLEASEEVARRARRPEQPSSPPRQLRA
eukprot:3141115-Alexandrium_andersonii.AAC.1